MESKGKGTKRTKNVYNQKHIRTVAALTENRIVQPRMDGHTAVKKNKSGN